MVQARQIVQDAKMKKDKELQEKLLALKEKQKEKENIEVEKAFKRGDNRHFSSKKFHVYNILGVAAKADKETSEKSLKDMNEQKDYEQIKSSTETELNALKVNSINPNRRLAEAEDEVKAQIEYFNKKKLSSNYFI